jgi:hypothetical protein
MRNVHKALTLLGLIVVGAAAQGVACANTVEDCALIGELCPGQTPQASSSSGTGGVGGGSLCDLHPKDNPAAITEECGVFVKPAVAAGEGTRQSPLGTVQAAVAKAAELSKKRVYACIGTFTETVSVPAGMTLFGGLDCAKAWEATDQRSTLKGTADKIPLTLQGDGKSETRIEAWNIEAIDATAAGGSSIAAIAQDSAVVHFESSSLTAGRGMNGMDGMSASSTPEPQPLPSTSGKDVACENTSMNPGGALNKNECTPENPEIPEKSIGGMGGDGYTSFGLAGQPGQADPVPAVPKGTGGQQGLSNCAMGGDGGNGANGADGQPGASGNAKGSLAPEMGYVGANGGDGTKGLPGQGGGGGGGQKGKDATPQKPKTCAGASGGAGGAGGCGGFGGKGGQAGGSSIALVSINATIKMVGVKLKTSSGGTGGAGGSSQTGAMGGLGGTGGGSMTVDFVTMYAGCKGGTGGNGGRGGPGGGGSGGHSIGIAYMGEAPTVDMTTFDVPLDGGGIGGTGGDGNASNNFGASGLSAQTLEF